MHAVIDVSNFSAHIISALQSEKWILLFLKLRYLYNCTTTADVGMGRRRDSLGKNARSRAHRLKVSHR